MPAWQSRTLLAGAFDGWSPRTWASAEKLHRQLLFVPQTRPPFFLTSLLLIVPALDHLLTPAPSGHPSHNSVVCKSQLRPAHKTPLSTSLLNLTETNKCFKLRLPFLSRSQFTRMSSSLSLTLVAHEVFTERKKGEDKHESSRLCLQDWQA